MRIKSCLFIVLSFFVVATMFAGCKKSEDANANTPVQLTWYLRGSKPQNGDIVIQKANEIISKKINATVDFKFLDGGAFNDKMQMVIASSEQYDLCFTSEWTNSYINNVTRGAYIPLDEMLNKYPEVKNAIPPQYWKAVKVRGEIYGIPNYQIMVRQSGIWLKKDLVEKYHIDVSKIKTASDLTPVFQVIKDNEPNIIPICAGNPVGAWATLSNVQNLGIDTKTWKVFDPYQDPRYTGSFKLMREWYEKGFFPSDIATLKDDGNITKEGKAFSRFTTVKPGIEAELKDAYHYDVVVVPLMKPFANRTSALAAVTSISITSKNAEKAMELVNLMNTDHELINLMAYGIEGQDYKKVSDNKVQLNPNSYKYAAWEFGNQFNSYLLNGQPDDAWEKTKTINEQAEADPIMDFIFDSSPVENDVAQMNAVNTEFKSLLNNGLAETDMLLRLRTDKMSKAGIDKVMKEIQVQLDKWRAEN